MEWKKIVAIIREDKLGEVQERLKGLRMVFVNSTQRRGYGEYTNLFSRDWSMAYARFEIYCQESYAEKIMKAIMDTAHTGMAGDGIVALIPVEKLYRIRHKAEVVPEEAGNSDDQ